MTNDPLKEAHLEVEAAIEKYLSLWSRHGRRIGAITVRRNCGTARIHFSSQSALAMGVENFQDEVHELVGMYNLPHADTLKVLGEAIIGGAALHAGSEAFDTMLAKIVERLSRYLPRGSLKDEVRELIDMYSPPPADTLKALGEALIGVAALHAGSEAFDTTLARVVERLSRYLPRVDREDLEERTQEILKRPYNLVVTEDRESEFPSWCACVAEFPGCYTDGHTPASALTRLEDTARDWVRTALANGLPIPEPLPSQAHLQRAVSQRLLSK